MPMQIQTVTFSEPKDGNASAEWQDGASGGVVGDGTATPAGPVRRARRRYRGRRSGALGGPAGEVVRAAGRGRGSAPGRASRDAGLVRRDAGSVGRRRAGLRHSSRSASSPRSDRSRPCSASRSMGSTARNPTRRAVALGDRFPSGSASAVRAARPGGYRADAATEPDDGAPRRHHLVVGIGIAVLRRVQAGATWTRATRSRASRIRAPRTAGTGRRRHRAGLRDRAPDRRRRWPRVRHRDRRTGRRRLGHLAARHRGRDQTARPDVTPSRLRYQVTQINHIARINHANIGNIWNLYSIWCR